MNYLDYEVTELPDSVENLFCKPLDQNGEIQKASEMQMSLIFFAMTSNNEEVDEMYESVKKEHMLLLILEDRLKKVGCPLDKASRLLISTACKSPAEVVMYSSYIRYKMKELGIDFLDIEKLCSEILPGGFFTEKTLREYWDLQKVKTESNRGSDNLLDYLKAYESMMK